MLVNSYHISTTLNAYNSKCHLWTYALLALMSLFVIALSMYFAGRGFNMFSMHSIRYSVDVIVLVCLKNFKLNCTDSDRWAWRIVP